jgi:methyltransferase (TIGR00027 family)
MRSRYVEDVLKEMAASGLRQYVNLGAGMDTFAYRQPAWAQALTLYEVDHPETQRWKQTNLQRLGIVPPANLCWCPLNFEEGGVAAWPGRRWLRCCCPSLLCLAGCDALPHRGGH